MKCQVVTDMKVCKKCVIGDQTLGVGFSSHRDTGSNSIIDIAYRLSYLRVTEQNIAQMGYGPICQLMI